MHAWPSIVLVVPAYLLAGSRGYWPVRWRTGIEVRTTGRGGCPARNGSSVLSSFQSKALQEAVAL